MKYEKCSLNTMIIWSIRGEGKIEKVFVLDFHGFIKQKEVFVG